MHCRNHRSATLGPVSHKSAVVHHVHRIFGVVGLEQIPRVGRLGNFEHSGVGHEPL